MNRVPWLLIALALGAATTTLGCGPDRELVASAVAHKCVAADAAAQLEDDPENAEQQARLEEALDFYETVVGGDSAIEEAATKEFEDNGCPDELPY